MEQISGFLYAFFLIISNLGQTTKRILLLQTISFFFKSLHYYLLNGYSAFITSIVSMIRNLIFCKINASRAWTITFIILYTIIGIATYQNIMSLLPILATITYTIIINYNKPTFLKIGTIITSILWLLYNLYINSYSGIIIQTIVLITTINSIINLDKKDQMNYNNK